MRVQLQMLVVLSMLLPVVASAGDDHAPIIATVKKRLPSFKLCFDEALKRRGHLEGKVVVAFEVDAAGKVSGARITQDTIKDPEVGCCAAMLMGNIRFPAPSHAPVQESFPFVFANPNAPSPPPKNPPPPTTYCAELAKRDAAAPQPAPAP